MMPILRPTVAEVDLKKLARNMRKVHEQAGEGVRVLTVLKANAFGSIFGKKQTKRFFWRGLGGGSIAVAPGGDIIAYFGFGQYLPV